MENFGYYIFCIIAFVVAFFFVKKITSCLIKTAVFFAVAAALAAIYLAYMA